LNASCTQVAKSNDPNTLLREDSEATAALSAFLRLALQGPTISLALQAWFEELSRVPFDSLTLDANARKGAETLVRRVRSVP